MKKINERNEQCKGKGKGKVKVKVKVKLNFEFSILSECMAWVKGQRWEGRCLHGMG